MMCSIKYRFWKRKKDQELAELIKRKFAKIYKEHYTDVTNGKKE